METGARARGLAGWARERALSDDVSGCWSRAKRDAAAERQSEVKGARPAKAGWPRAFEPALPSLLRRAGLRMNRPVGRFTNSTATPKRASPRCAILIGSNAIRNLRIPLKPHDMFFSNRSKIACLRARFAHVSRSKNHDSRCTCRDSRFANHQSLLTNHAFLIASVSAVLSGAPNSAIRRLPFPGTRGPRIAGRQVPADLEARPISRRSETRGRRRCANYFGGRSCHCSGGCSNNLLRWRAAIRVQ
jgi:hypothetical protein